MPRTRWSTFLMLRSQVKLLNAAKHAGQAETERLDLTHCRQPAYLIFDNFLGTPITPNFQATELNMEPDPYISLTGNFCTESVTKSTKHLTLQRQLTAR